MQGNPFPAANLRADQVELVDGNRRGESTGDRLAAASDIYRAYSEHSTRLSAANQDAPWEGCLSRGVSANPCGSGVHAPRQRTTARPPSHPSLSIPMHIEPVPNAKYGVSVVGFGWDETMGMHLAERALEPRAYANHQASAVQRAHAGLTGRLQAAIKAAVSIGILSRN